MLCGIPFVTDYVEIIVGALTLGALISVIFQIINEKKERKEDIAALKSQTSSLENIASNGQQQTEILIAQNCNLETQNSQLAIQVKLFGDLLATFASDKESKTQRDFFEAERSRADQMPHFFPVSWYVSTEELRIMIQNRGGTAKNLTIIKDSGNIKINEFDSVIIEKSKNVTITGRLTSYSIPGIDINAAGKTPVTIVIQYEDIYTNIYKQTFDFPEGMRGGKPFFSPPDLVQRSQPLQ